MNALSNVSKYLTTTSTAVVTGAALEDFKRSYPCHGLDGISSVAFGFDPNGDLAEIDMLDDGELYADSSDYDGPALAALADTAWRRHTPIRSRAAIQTRLWSRAAVERAKVILAPVYGNATPQREPGQYHLADASSAFRYVGDVECGSHRIARHGRPNGWYTADEGWTGETVVGVVYRIVGKRGHQRFVAGYRLSTDDAGSAVLDLSEYYASKGDCDDAAPEACRAADLMAQRVAEKECDYHRAWQAGSDHLAQAETVASTRKAALSLLAEFKRARSVMAPMQFPMLCAEIRARIASARQDMNNAREKMSALRGEYAPSRDYGAALEQWPGFSQWQAFQDGAGL